MNCASVVERLEVALIELEYASADFAHTRSTTHGEVDAGMLTTVAQKLMAAQRAMQIALEVLGTDDATVRPRCAA